jgi:hypothetical protein
VPRTTCARPTDGSSPTPNYSRRPAADRIDPRFEAKASRSHRRAYFALRAQSAVAVAGGLSLSLLAELHSSNRLLYDRLTGCSLVIAVALCELISIAVLTAHTPRLKGTRLVAALGVAAVIWGWGVAQYPSCCRYDG